MCSVTLGIQGLNPPGKGDEEDARGFTKRFPTHHAYPKCLAASLCGLASRQDREKVGVTLVNWDNPLRTDSAS